MVVILPEIEMWCSSQKLREIFFFFFAPFKEETSIEMIYSPYKTEKIGLLFF